MFGTVLWDVYRKIETLALHEAIEDIASATDNYGWSSTGVYAFYDPASRSTGEPLESPLRYLGLATDLPKRFAQHNGIISTPPNSSKWQNIQAWFETHETLGYSAFVQSPLHQAHVARFKKEFMDSTFVDWTEYFDYDLEARRSIALLEGQLIQTAVTEQGSLPVWNKIGGSRDGRARAAGGTGSALIGLMTGSIDNLFVARRSIRELSSSIDLCAIETDLLHNARMQALFYAWDNRASSDDIRSRLEQYGQPGSPFRDPHIADALVRMLASDYLTSSTRGHHSLMAQEGATSSGRERRPADSSS